MQVIESEKVPNSTLLNVELSSVHGLQHSISATGPHVKWMCINPIDRPIKVKTPIDGWKKPENGANQFISSGGSVVFLG